MNLAQLLVRAARSYPERPAIYLGEKVIYKYQDFADRSARLASHLQNNLNLQSGDRVAIYMSNHVSYLEILYATWWAGLVVVPINSKLHAKEALFILEDSKAKVVFVTSDLAADLLPTLHTLDSVVGVFTPGKSTYEALQSAMPIVASHRDPNDLAWLFYTSGTTGRPKGVMQSHRNLFAMTSCYFSDVDSVGENDALVYAAPMSHGAGMYNFAFVSRAARHVVPASAGFEPEELVQLSQKIGNLCFFAAPTMVKRLVDHIEVSLPEINGFKTIVYGGGPMYVEDIQKALKLMGPRFVQIYGQGESPMTITALSRTTLANQTHPQWQQRIASVGHAQTLVEVRVADEQGHELPPNQTGEVLVRGETVMKSYWNAPEATASAIRDGWLWTGDMGSMDSHGFLTLKDRSKDVIISGGSNIYPREVEEVILRHPLVSEVSVVGQSDPEWGEIVVAFVVAKGVDQSELDQLCLQNIARFKRPKTYHFVKSLPKNNYGKVLKTALRQALSNLSDSIKLP